MSEKMKLFWTNPRYRYYRIALFFLLLVVVTDVAVRVYFLRRGIVDRNPGNTTAAMDYLFGQMKRAKHPKVVFIGSSVTQGYGNCPPGKHFPGLVGKELRKYPQYKNARTFNLSSAGNRFGDHFGNMVESNRYQPDLFVIAIHLKMFSVHSSLIDPITHDEVLYYFRDEPDYQRGGPKDLFKRFRVKDERYRQIWLDFQMKQISGLYKYRRLIGYLISGQHQLPAAAMSDRLRAWLGILDEIMVESYDTTHEERNADYLWKVIPSHVVQLNYHQCEAFDFSDENIGWLTFKDLCEYGQKNNLNILFFINPINHDFVDQKQFFDWGEVMPLFKQRILSVTRQYGYQVVDCTDRIDPRYFSDLDHLNMNGHKQMTQILMPHILTALRRK